MKPRKKVIIINTETTGLDAKTDELLRISILSDSGRIIFDELVRPTRHTEWPESEKIHHISPEMVKDKQPILYHLKELNRIIADADMIVGYNHSFDMSFLAEAGIYSDPRKNYDLMLEFSQLVGEWDDTRNSYRFFKLKECADYLGYRWPSGKDHDCLEDCKATLYCYKKLISGESEKGGTPNNRRFQSSFNASPVKLPIPAIFGAFISVAALIIIALQLVSSAKEDRIIHELEAGQGSDPMYSAYSNLLAADSLDENGYYQHAANEAGESAVPLGPIHVTFAKNAYMDIHYYHDERLTDELSTVDCYMSPGEKIYADIENIGYHDLVSSMYKLTAFEIRELDNSGNTVKKISQSLSSIGNIISLDVSKTCGEISIVPVGAFQNRKLQLDGFYYNSDTEKKTLGVLWTINGIPYDSKVGINPIVDYQARCNFSAYAQTYYFVDANPKYSFDVDHNEILFDPVKPTGKDLTYSVELHPYIELTIKDPEYGLSEKLHSGNTIISKIERERAGNRSSIVFKDGAIVAADELSALKHADLVYVTLNSSYQLISANNNISISKPSAGSIKGTEEYCVQIPKNNYCDLTLVVTEKNNTSSDSIFLPTIDNAVVSLKYNKGYAIYDGSTKPNESEKVVLTITANPGYYLEGKGVQKNGSYTKAMVFKEYENTIEKILKSLSVKKYITLNLTMQNQYGTCTYKLDREKISDGTIQAKEGQTLIVEFKAAPNISVINEKGKAKSSAKVEIILSSKNDGQTITPEELFTVKVGK